VFTQASGSDYLIPDIWKCKLSIKGHRKPKTTKVFVFLRKRGAGVGDYRPPVNSSEFLVRKVFEFVDKALNEVHLQTQAAHLRGRKTSIIRRDS